MKIELIKLSMQKLTILLCFFLFPVGEYAGEQTKITYAAEQENSDQDELYDLDLEDAYLNVEDMLGLDTVKLSLPSGYSPRITFRKLVELVRTGEYRELIHQCINVIKGILFGEIAENKSILIEILLIVLLGTIFSHLSNSFGVNFVGENGFYVSYLVLTALLMVSFSTYLSIVTNGITMVENTMKVFVPVYGVAMNFTGYSKTATGMYELVLIGILLVETVFRKLILPLIQFFVTISILNNIRNDESFSTLCKSIKKLVTWLLKTVLLFVVGLNVIKSLIDPQIDALGRSTVDKIISAIPGGGAVSVLTGTFLGAGLVIKNSIGIAGVILVLLLLIVPIFKTAVFRIMIWFASVVAEPFGEKRFSKSLEILSEGIGLLMKTMLTAMVLFVLTIAIMAFATCGVK